jgi:hypothetical protein
LWTKRWRLSITPSFQPLSPDLSVKHSLGILTLRTHLSFYCWVMGLLEYVAWLHKFCPHRWESREVGNSLYLYQGADNAYFSLWLASTFFLLSCLCP